MQLRTENTLKQLSLILIAHNELKALVQGIDLYAWTPKQFGTQLSKKWTLFP